MLSKIWKSTLLAAVACALVGAPLVAAPADRVLEVFPERPGGAYDAEKVRREQVRLHAGLELEQVRAGVDEPYVVRLGARRLEALEKYQPGERPIRVGAKKRLNLRLDFARPEQPFGASRVLGDGSRVWTGTLRSAGAVAVRLQFADFDLPPGHDLYIYTADGQVRGPYSGRGPGSSGSFWSHTLFGDAAILQLEIPAGSERAARFTVRRIGHMGPKFQLGARRGAGQGSFIEAAFCSFNASCVENANCGSTSSAVTDARDAVAQILFPSGGGFYICSGGLLADTDESSVRELFLTANHCISRGSEAAGSESFFQFEVGCGGPCVDFDNGSFPSVAGATILKTSKRSDYTLLELGGAAPGGSAYLGWTSSAVANSNGVDLFRISHPGGAPQAYSEHVVDTSKTTCGSWPRGRWIYSADTFGATEGGSSGSPVVNSAGQVVGQLSGACGFNVNDVCDADSNATVDGAFAAYFGQISSILDPGDGGGDACVPGSAPKGASCTQDSDCQSCKCKGGANKTCK